MNKSPNEFDPKDLMSKSGNTLHSKTVKRLRDLGWSVLVSPYYPDNATDVSREVDIIAEQHSLVTINGGSLSSSTYESVAIRLYIECKHINSNIVFWFDEKDSQQAWKLIGSQIGDANPQQNTFCRKHHYQNGNHVAKLFETDKSSKLEKEPMYTAINQSLSSMEYYRRQPNLFPSAEHVLHRLNYPIIVCDDFSKFHAVNMDNPEKIVDIPEPFQLEVNYAYRTHTNESAQEYHLIDVVALDGLESLLEKVMTDDFRALQNTMENTARRSENNRLFNS